MSQLPTTVRTTVSVEMPDGILVEIPIQVTATYEKKPQDHQVSDPGGWDITSVTLDEESIG